MTKTQIKKLGYPTSNIAYGLELNAYIREMDGLPPKEILAPADLEAKTIVVFRQQGLFNKQNKEMR